MKKITLISLILLATVTCLPVFGNAASLYHGQPTSQFSPDKTASALIVSGPCIFHGMVVKTDGINAVTITIYDGTSTAGTSKVLPGGTVIQGGSTPWAVSITPPAIMTQGIYISTSVAGGGSYTYTVEYDQ